MWNFTFCSPTRFYFGRDAEAKVGEALKADGASNVLIHIGKSSVRRSGLLDNVTAQLDAQGIRCHLLEGAQPNPRSELAEQGAELCRRENIDYILALGGGSCLDSAKAIAVLACGDKTLLDYYTGKATPQRALPIATVMTFPATGSEASNSSVINFDAEGLKRGLSSDLIRPRLAFLNPELSYTLPEFQTFCGVADIMAHTMERYFNDGLENQIVNAWSEALLRELIQAARTVKVDPQNYNARATLMWASTVAHNGLLSAGLEKEDWASHALEHELSFQYDVAHGAGLAVVFPNWIRYMAERKPEKPAKFAREVFGISGDYNDLKTWALRGARELQRFFRDCGLPLTFEELGARREDIPKMAANVKRGPDGTTGSYIPLDEEACREIYELCCGPTLLEQGGI